MSHFLKNGFKKFIALLMVLTIIFSTNSFDTLSRVYAEGGIATKSSFTNDSKEKVSDDEENNVSANKEEKEEDEKLATDSETSEKEDTSSTTHDEDEEDDKPATMSEISKDDTSKNNDSENESDIDHHATKSEIDKEKDDDEAEEKTSDANIATESETNEVKEIKEKNEIDETKENITIASASDIKIATENEIKTSYDELDTYSQITFYDKSAASLDGNTIKLEKDLELKDALYFKKGLNLDLAGHNIIAPNDNYAIYVEKSFTLYNTADTLGKIEGSSNEYPTIYLNDADVRFSGGKIYGAKGTKDDEAKDLNGGDAIHSYNSNLTFNGSLIYGGNGKENDKGKGGNGGDAVVVMTATKTNTIYVESGTLKGGDGGAGLGDAEPEKGAALKVDTKVYDNEYFGQGLPGNVGGGSGGVALNIKDKKFKSNNLGYENYTLNAGHAGYSKKEAINRNSIKIKTRDDVFGTGASDSYYSLHDLDGKNYLTSLKSQGNTGLCTAFSTTAYAESYLIKNYPNFVRNTLGKDVDNTLSLANWNANSNELNLSEVYFGMQMFTQAKDEFGNAGLSRYISDVSHESNWAYNGANTRILSINPTTWRSFIEEDPTSQLAWPSAAAEVLVTSPIDRTLLNSYTNKTVVHAKNGIVHDASEYFNGTSFDRTGFISQLKNDIVNHTGVVICIYTGDRQDRAKINDTTYEYSKNGTSYGDYLASLNTPNELSKSIDLGGHALYCIGWDDDVVYTDTLGTHTGAFICKNSWTMFTLVPYDNAWALYYGDDANDGNPHVPNKFVDYIAIDFTPAFSQYENNYFYDTGIGTAYVDQDNGISTFSTNYNTSTYGNIKYSIKVKYKSVFNVFEIKHDKEKVKAISFNVIEPGDYDVSLYRVTSLTNANQLANDMVDANRLLSASLSARKGINTIDVTAVDLSKNDKVAVKVTRTDKDNFGSVFFDSVVDQTYERTNPDHTKTLCGPRYETVAQGKSFFADPYVKVTEITNAGNVYTESDPMFATLYALDGRGAASENNVAGTISVKVSKLIDDANARIRLYTNNYIKLDANGKGKFSNNDTVTYVYPTLRTALGVIEEPSPDQSTDTFTKYNTKADGTGVDYTTSSIYNMDISKSLTLYAQYTSGAGSATLSFSSGGGIGTMTSMTRPVGTTVHAPASSFTKTGYTFDHWNDGTNDVSVGDPVTLNTDITLTAKWKENEYDINYVENGGSFVAGSPYARKRKYTEDKTLPTSADIAKTGYLFAGWYDNEGLIGNVVTSTNAANTEKTPTYYAKWDPIRYTIEYVPNGGTVTPTSFTKYYGTDVTTLATPVRGKDRFEGWYTNNTLTTLYNKGDLSTVHNDKKYIYAKWTNVYTVSFDMKGHGTQVAAQDIVDGGKVKEPTNVVAANQRFDGWFTDDTYSTKWNFATNTVTSNRTLVAKWTYVPTITFKFVTDHGKTPEPQYIFNNTKLVEPDKIKVLGYNFLYWYEDDENTAFDFSKSIKVTKEGERTLYAKWETLTYKVKLNVGNGEITAGNITSYTFGIGAKLPVDVIAKDKGQVFAGWYDNKDFKGDPCEIIKATDYGDKEFFAKYETASNPPSGGGSSPSGGGGSSGSRSGGAINPSALKPAANPTVNPLAANVAATNESRETKLDISVRNIPINYNTSDSVWENDSNGDRHLSVKNEFGQYVEAKNMFACVVTVHKDSEGKNFDIQDFYYFDNDGKMYTGWLKDPNNTTFYFDANPGSEIGKLSRGWTKIGGDYYYFDGSGELQTNTVTPDGYNVDASGKWASSNTEKK